MENKTFSISSNLNKTNKINLVDAVKTFGETHEFTKLVPNLTDKNPDDSFSLIPYEKGFMLMYHLEEKLGGIEVFDKYLMAHVKKFDSKSFDTNDWKAFLYEYFNDKVGFLLFRFNVSIFKLFH
jgi:leukotriene-A4 hydrolase